MNENCLFYGLKSKKKLAKFLSNGKDKNIEKIYSIIKNKNSLNNFIREKIISYTINTKNKIRPIVYAKKGLYKQIVKKMLIILRKYVTEIWNCGEIKYLFSGIQNVDYVKNANAHKNNKVMLKIDFKDYFNNISAKKINNFFNKKFNTSKDIANILTLLIIGGAKNNNNSKNNTNSLKQGLECSTIMSFLVNKDVFDQIYSKCNQWNYVMTLYVDDLTITSPTNILNEHIQAIINILIKYKIKINRKKICLHTFSKKINTITGVSIRKGKIFPSENTIEKMKNTTSKKSLQGYISYINYINKINKKD